MPPPPSPPIGLAMNTATRPLHTTLNRTITFLLPLALPPHTASPHLYALGISSLLPIYSTFESLYTTLLTSPPPHLSPRTRTLLSTLHTPALKRTARLRADLDRLLHSPSKSETERYGPRLEAFITHIETAIQARPYLLLAYAWNLYMALFAGGRYLRGQLRGSNFFDDEGSLSFWGFEGEHDGEDVKAGFKARVERVDAEGMLTEGERRDVVEESVEIMRWLVEVVRELEVAVPMRVRGGGGSGSGSVSEEGASEKSRVLGLPGSVLRVVGGFGRSVVERLGYGHGSAAAAASPLA